MMNVEILSVCVSVCLCVCHGPARYSFHAHGHNEAHADKIQLGTAAVGQSS